MTPVDLTTTKRKETTTMSDVTPLNPAHAKAIAAWKAACAGEGMSLAEASAILRDIGYDHDWTTEELIAAVPGDMIDDVITALLISQGAHLAEADALKRYLAERRG